MGAYSSSFLYHHINWSKLLWLVGVSYLVWYWSTFPERVYGLHKSNWIFLRVHRSIRSSFGTYLGIFSFPKRSMGPKGSDFQSSRELVEVSLKGQWVTWVHIFAPPRNWSKFSKKMSIRHLGSIYHPYNIFPYGSPIWVPGIGQNFQRKNRPLGDPCRCRFPYFSRDTFLKKWSPWVHIFVPSPEVVNISKKVSLRFHVFIPVHKLVKI